MEAFEYLSVLISIILGLALTQLLTGAGRLIRIRDRVAFFTPVAIWMGVLFIIIVQSWWTMFTLRLYDEWTFDRFLVVLLHPMLVYLLVELITPDVEGGGGVDMKANYFRQAPVFFGAMLGLLLASLARPLVLTWRFTPWLDFAFHAVFIALSIIAIFWRSERFHRLASLLVVLLLFVYVASMFVELR